MQQPPPPEVLQLIQLLQLDPSTIIQFKMESKETATPVATPESEQVAVHPLFKMIAEDDAKGITKLFEVTQDPKKLLLTPVPLNVLPVVSRERAKLDKNLQLMTPMIATILHRRAASLGALIDAARQHKLLDEIQKGVYLETKEVVEADLNRPLYYAVSTGWLRGIDIMLKKGRFEWHQHSSAFYFILSDVFRRDIDITFNWLLTNGGLTYDLMKNPKTGDHFRMVEVAASHGASCCLYVLERHSDGKELHYVNKNGHGPLFQAVGKHKMDAAFWLTSRGVSPVDYAQTMDMMQRVNNCNCGLCSKYDQAHVDAIKELHALRLEQEQDTILDKALDELA
jgi:hypothetical protein